MSNRWRIVNPALSPAQVIAESGDEQAILRQCATRDASDGLKLLKSEDDGQTWAEVEVRAPDAGWKPPPEEPLKGIKAAPSSAEKSDADTRRELERGELGGSSEHTETPRTSKKTSK